MAFDACLARCLVSQPSSQHCSSELGPNTRAQGNAIARLHCRTSLLIHSIVIGSKNAPLMRHSTSMSHALLLACTASALYVRPQRTLPRRTVSMKWGEHIGDHDFLRNADGRPSQLQRDHGKLVITLATTGNINTCLLYTSPSPRDRG